jgi:xanthine/uracil permease
VGSETEHDRRSEWFVPDFGPLKFRLFIGLLFLPYTGMVLAYTVVGSMLAEQIYWDRVVAILVIYFLALGIGGHALDALGSKGNKPWGSVFSKSQLWTLAIVFLVLAYAIGMYYMVLYTPLLWIIAILEGFFVLAYNLEWFRGRFHTDGWFALSWGSLPVMAGYVLQTNRISLVAVMVAAAMGLFSLVEIKASRPYKSLKRVSEETGTLQDNGHMQQFEAILKSISLGVILLGVGLLSWRWFS